MSLVRASLQARRRVGAAFIGGLVATVAFVLVTSGRTLGSGLRFEVELGATGALKGDAKVRIAGREVGEVRGMRREAVAGGRRHVILDAFVAREWAGYIHKNSVVFVATPSILGEAALEIGPARNARGEGDEPGAPIVEGERLRGIDPPELDHFVAQVYDSLTAIGFLLHEHRGELDELLTGADSLLATLSGLPADQGQLGRIRDQIVRAVDDTRAIVAALDGAQAVPRIRALAKDLGELADRIGPDLADLQRKGELAAARLEGLGSLLSPQRKLEVEAGLAAFARATRLAEAIGADVKYLSDRVLRGEGTLGAFAADEEIFDELHEVHRILKTYPWRVVIKSKGKSPKR